MKRLTMKTIKGSTFVNMGRDCGDMVFGAAKEGLDCAVQYVFQRKFIECVLGNREEVITHLPKTAFPVRSLIPPTPRTKTTFKISDEEETISDRLVQITA
jgi:hypothetical protein